MLVDKLFPIVVAAIVGCERRSGPPAPTPTPKPGEATAGCEFLVDLCELSEGDPEAWRDAVSTVQEGIDFGEDRPATRGFQDYVDTQIVMPHPWAEHV